MAVAATVALDNTNCKVALSMREKLHVPLGWWSSGRKAKEYTLIPCRGDECGVGKVVLSQSMFLHVR